MSTQALQKNEEAMVTDGSQIEGAAEHGGSQTPRRRRVRIQIDLSEKAIDEINAMLEETGVANKAELTLTALRWMRWTIAALKDDSKLMLITRDGHEREIIPVFMEWKHRERISAQATF